MDFLNLNFIGLLFIALIAFIFAYKKITKNPDALTSKFETKLTINGNTEDHLKVIMEALKNAGFRKVGLDQDKNHFFAQTEISTPFFSEYIVVKYRSEHSSAILDFKSICVLPTQLLDWGRNKSNYRNFEEQLEKLVQPAQLQKVG